MVQLFQGDCLEVMKTIPDSSVDMILCDPPYGTTACKWDVVIPFNRMWEHLQRVVKENGAICLFGTEPFSSYLRISNIKNFRYDYQWQKDKAANFLFGNKQPLKICEYISVFYRKQPTYNPQKTINPKGVSQRHLHKNPSKISQSAKQIMGKSWKESQMGEEKNYHGKTYEPDKLLPKSLIYFKKDQRNKLHPTQKPVELLEYLIRTYTFENETILDFTMGSGSTGVACSNTKRRFIGIEKDPAYFEIAKQRITQLNN